MQWLILLTAALVLATLGKYVKPIDEVYAIAAYGTGFLIGLWGFVVAPISVQVILGVLVFGWLQVISLHSKLLDFTTLTKQ